MTSSIASITFDATDAADLAAFWSAVLGRNVVPEPSEFFAILEGSPMMMFIKVPEPKTAKNRCHLDLGTDDVSAEVKRLDELGAEFVHEKEEFGINWTTLRDPQGNEFCVSARRD